MMRKIALLLISITLLITAFLITDIEDVLQNFLKFPLWLVFLVLGLFGLNLVVVTFRLERVLFHFGITIPKNVVLKSSVSGYLAGLFFISLFGQVAGRHIVLNKFGVPSVFLAFLTAYERIVLLIISGSLSFVGAIFIIGGSTVSEFLNDISLAEIVVTATGGIFLSFWIGRSRFESSLIKNTKSWKNIVNVLEISAITLIAQLLIFATFVLGVLILEPEVDIFELLAAVAIISFAASLPITVNGWGIRELAAVYMLGQIGITSSVALSVSILVGLCSTAIIIIVAPIVLKNKVNADDKQQLSNFNADIHSLDIEKAAVWLIVTATAVLLFFQIHLTFSGGVINVNLADPFAILALSATALHIISSRQLPYWRIPQFNKMLIAISILLVFAFFNGVIEIGITQWALAGRLFGWLVLLGYLSVGYLTILYLGAHGLRRLSETMVSTAVVVIIVQITIRLLDSSGWLSDLRITPHFEGFAGNRNAFSFQMLVCLILILAYSKLYIRLDSFETKKTAISYFSKQLNKFFNINTVGSRQLIFSLLNGFIIASLALSASRAGLITGALLLSLALIGKLVEYRFVFLSIFFAILIWFLLQLVIILINFIEPSAQFYSSGFSSAGSNVERWLSITKGLAMWFESPFFGSGLGVFIEKSVEWHDKPLVIHNTPVWILAELGLIGAGIFIGSMAVFLHFLFKNRWVSPAYSIFAMLLFVFILFGLVHEIFYQRIFWLILGAVMAVSLSNKNKEKQSIIVDSNE